MNIRIPSRGIFRTLLPLAFIAAAWSQEPKIRTTLDAPDEVWTGQRVILKTELLAPGYFASSAAFDLPDPPGMMLVPPTGSPVIRTEEIDGTTYTIQRHELSVFTNRSGRQTIPPFKVRFSYKRNPLDKEVVAGTVESAPLEISPKSPPGSEKLGTVISARDLKAIETWNPEPGEAKAGDAFTRTITYSAPDVPAMAFPPFPSQPVDGMGIYPKPPVVADHSERGEFRGERRDSITYVCKRAGTFVIPASRLTWFDLGSRQLKTIDFPARTIEVAPNPALASQAQAAVKRKPDRKSLLLPIGAIAIVVVLFRTLMRPGVRAFLARLVRPLFPVHLQPLNPSGSESNGSARRH